MLLLNLERLDSLLEGLDEGAMVFGLRLEIGVEALDVALVAQFLRLEAGFKALDMLLQPGDVRVMLVIKIFRGRHNISEPHGVVLVARELDLESGEARKNLRCEGIPVHRCWRRRLQPCCAPLTGF